MSSPTMLSRMFSPFRAIPRWLANVPITDPVDRRNATMLQVVLILMGTLFVLLSFPRWTSGDAWPIEWDVEFKNFITIAVFIASVRLVRMGRFRLGAGLFVGMTLIAMAISYHRYGLSAELAIQVTQMIPVVLAGLILGRRVLWSVVAAYLGILIIGMVVDLQGGSAMPHAQDTAVFNLIRCGLGFIFIAFIIDHAVSALRQNLALATLRGEQLEAMQRVLEREQAQLIHAQKVEAVGRVSSGLAHDFNTMLGVIMGYASRPDAEASHEVAMDALDGIKLAAQRGAMSVRRVLALGRPSRTATGPIDVRTAITDMQPLMRQIFGARIQLDVHLPTAAAPVTVDRSEFELAMLNLATNARDAMPAGGVFRIDVAVTDDTVELKVSDTGQGMSAITREHVFDTFFTTKAVANGSGIGLAVVKQMVDAIDGEISVESEEGRGSRFLLSLPLAATAPVTYDAAALVDLRVLLVEDDEALRMLLGQALGAAGIAVTAVGTVAEARTSGQAFDVVVADYRLPDGTGLDVFQHASTAALLGMSAETRDLAAQAPRFAHVPWLAKPFAPSELVAAVAQLAIRSLVETSTSDR